MQRKQTSKRSERPPVPSASPGAIDRRDLLRAVAAGLALPALVGLEPSRLFAAGAAVHSRVAAEDAAPARRRVLDREQDAIVIELCDLIIPATDTPGAKAARVNEFIDHLLADWFPAEARERYLKGLVKLDRRARRQFRNPFVDCGEAEQTALLSELERQAIRRRRGRPIAVGDGSRLADLHFFDTTKWLVLFGYYTSEIGMVEELKHRVVPGSYDACTAL